MDERDFTKLTQRRDRDRPDCWHVYWQDIRAGTIAKAVGSPNAGETWTWAAGFFPGSRPREIRHGEATSFEEARAAFLPAWIAFAKSRRPEDFEEYREQARFTAEKYARFDRGECMPLNRPILQFEPVDRFERVSLSGRNFGLAPCLRGSHWEHHGPDLWLLSVMRTPGSAPAFL